MLALAHFISPLHFDYNQDVEAMMQQIIASIGQDKSLLCSLKGE